MTDVEGEKGEVEAGGAGANGYGVRDSVVGGEGGFKGGKFWAEAQMGGAKDGGHGFDFLLGYVGGTEGYCHRWLEERS